MTKITPITSRIRAIRPEYSHLLSTLYLCTAISLPLALPTLAMAQTTSTQTKATTHLSGRVLDEKKLPLYGATIQVKGSSLRTITNTKGEFHLPNIPSGATIVVSYVGFRTQTIPLQGKTNLAITLVEDNQLLSEVVVTGYQEVKKQRMTGATTVLRASDLKNINVSSVDQVLRGTMAGVSASYSGRPGADLTIRVRGMNTLSGNADPIWIIDGMPLQGEPPRILGGNLKDQLSQSGIGNVAPEDIESITVLKDAAATAIYGARAANGVIVIKTKSGKEGDARYNFTAQYGWTERPYLNVRMMNAAEKVAFERQMYNEYGSPDFGRASYILQSIDKGVLSREEGEKQIAALSQTNTAWFRQLYRTGQTAKVNGSVSGGSKRTQYYLSLNYLNELGTELNNSYQRFGVNSKINHAFTPKVKLQSTLSASYRSDKRQASVISALRYATFANPYETPDSPDQSYDMSKSSVRPGFAWTTLNAKEELLRNTATTNTLTASLNVKLDWETPLEGLTASTQAILSGSSNSSRNEEGERTYTNFKNNWLSGRWAYSDLLPEHVRGSLTEGVFSSQSYSWRNTLHYNRTLNTKHYIDALAGMEISDRLMYSSEAYSAVYDQAHRLAGYPDLPEGTDLKSIPLSRLSNTGKYQSKLSSLFAQASYSYDDRYVLSGSVRYDGSDIIGNDNQFTPLWNLSARWNVDREDFVKLRDLSTLSLRLGYGYTGSIDKNALPFVVMRYRDNTLYDGAIAPSSFSYANPNIKWQTKRDFNLGLDLGLWNDRLRLEVNYYNNLVFDLLDNNSRPNSSGVTSITENVANVVNRGWEIDLAAKLLSTTRVQWDLRANIAINKNIITKTFYRSLDEVPNAKTTKSASSSLYVEGYPVDGWFGYRYAGVDPNTGHTLAYTEDGNTFDMDKLSNVTLDLKAPKLSYLGDYNPPIVGGLSTSFTWTNYFISLSLEYQLGHYIRSFQDRSTFSSLNRYIGEQGRWRAVGDQAQIPGLSINDTAYDKYRYDSLLERGDYLRCSYLTVGYNLPERLLKSLRIKSARIALMTNNLFTLTNYSGIDPALHGSFGYPSTRSYSLSFSIGL